MSIWFEIYLFGFVIAYGMFQNGSPDTSGLNAIPAAFWPLFALWILYEMIRDLM